MKADISATLVVLARAPVAGRVKTRLIPELGEAKATRIYRQLLDRVLKLSLKAGFERVNWFIDEAHDGFECSQGRASLFRQAEGDLGLRMQDAFERSLNAAQAVILIGSDCPTLDVDYLEAAVEALDQGCDVVIGPAIDGGYVLIGMRNLHAAIFSSIDWGTGRVLEQTLARTTSARLEVTLLEARADIDTASDYRAWMAQENAGGVASF